MSIVIIYVQVSYVNSVAMVDGQMSSELVVEDKFYGSSYVSCVMKWYIHKYRQKKSITTIAIYNELWVYKTTSSFFLYANIAL